MFDQKEIVLIPFPYSDLSGSKKRPALIISNSKLNKTEDRICVLITSNSHENDLELTKNSFDSGALPFKSFVKPHRIFTINEKIIIKKLCSINNNFYDKIIEKIEDYINRT